MDAEGVAPAGPGHACDGRRPPHARPDKRPTRRDIHDLSRPHAQDGVHASRHEEGQVGVGTQTPIGDEDVPWVSGRVDRLHPGEIVGEQGRDHAAEALQEAGKAAYRESGAGLAGGGRREP